MADGTIPAPYRPHPDDIISGGAYVYNSTDPSEFLTIPAGRTWCGSLSVVASGGRETSGGEAGDTRVLVAGEDASPEEDTVLAVASSRRDGGPQAVHHAEVYVAAPAGNDVTLTVVNSISGAGATTNKYAGMASACGVLL